MKKENRGSLDEIFIDGSEVDENLIQNILVRFIRIEKESMSLIPTPEYEKLKEKQKVLICLLSRKAMKLRHMTTHEHMSPTEISKVSGVKKGTVRPVIRDYLNANLLRKEKDGYFIPDFALERVREVLES
jgi:hypothetical protein